LLARHSFDLVLKADLAEQGQRLMHPLSPSGEERLFWPFFLYGGLVVLGVAALVFVSYLLGQRHEAPGRNIPYESGITPTRSARLRYGVHFYTVGIFFILFDVEAAFLFAWAVGFRELGWVGYVEAVLFIAVLLLGLVYIWRCGGLDWSPSRRRARGEQER
jgi:NADH-quinone oxidoreductase subunit A